MTTQNFVYDKNKDIFAEPQEYKGIKFYPLKIKDTKWINIMYQLFFYPKTFLSKIEPAIYKMSYLKFLIIVVSKSDPQMKDTDVEILLSDFLKFITRAESVKISLFGNFDQFEHYDFKIIIDGVQFLASEFDDIREIVLRQNGSSTQYVESYNDVFEKAQRWIYRKQPSYNFIDQVFTFAALMKRTVSEIKECTLYEMKNMMESLSNILHYSKQTVPLTHVGKDYEITPYMTHFEEKDRYRDIKIDVDTFKQNSPYFKSEDDLKRDMLNKK